MLALSTASRVALDRDGQADRARHVIEQVLEHDPTLARLHDDDAVFFDAARATCDYYEGSAHEGRWVTPRSR